MHTPAWEGVTIIEIQCGRHGIWGVRNSDMVPLGGLLQLRNASLEDHTWRTGGGSEKLGGPIAGAPAIQRAIDYWPTPATQRTVVFCADGTLRKDDGAGAGWATLATGLSAAGVPAVAIGGAESVGRARKLFFCNRVNPVQVLAADGAATANLANPPADWTGANQPGFLFQHGGFFWGGGNANDPHRVYRSLQTDHEDYTTTPYSRPIFPGEGNRLVAGISFKQFALLFKEPTGVYGLDTRDANPANWTAFRIGSGGAGGPHLVALLPSDVLSVDPLGHWYLVSASQEAGEVKAESFSQTQLGTWAHDHINRAQLPYADLVSYEDKRQLLLAYAPLGQTAKTERLELDISGLPDLGARWIFADRDDNAALFIRTQDGGVQIPAMGDLAGQLWELDRVTRAVDGQPFTFEWFLRDTDFSQVLKRAAGRKFRLVFMQLIYDHRSAATHTVEVYRDGMKKQDVAFVLPGGGATLPVTLPFTLGIESLRPTRPRRLKGVASRVAFRGFTTAAADVSLAKIIIGIKKAA